MVEASKNTITQFINGFLFSGAILLTSCACPVAQKDQSIIINMPYHDARELILQSGWEPVQADRSEMDDKYRLPHFYYDAGYTEVMACSGTGMGYCSFKFQNETGEYLRVTTQGGDYSVEDDHPPVVIYAGISEDFN